MAQIKKIYFRFYMYINSFIDFNLLHDHKSFAVFSTYFSSSLYTEKLLNQQNKVSFYVDTIFILHLILLFCILGK